MHTLYLPFLGFGGGWEQLDGFKAILKGIEPEASFQDPTPYDQAPYPTPAEIVAADTNILIDKLEENPDIQVGFVGFSMGGQRALRTNEQLSQAGFGSRIFRTVPIDPPWNGDCIAGVSGAFTRLCGRYPSLARHSKLTAQCSAIATSMDGFDPNKVDFEHVRFITCTDNRNVIDSNKALDGWREIMDPSVKLTVHAIEGLHGCLTPDKSPKPKLVDKWKVAQYNLRQALEIALAKLRQMAARHSNEPLVFRSIDPKTLPVLQVGTPR